MYSELPNENNGKEELTMPKWSLR